MLFRSITAFYLQIEGNSFSPLHQLVSIADALPNVKTELKNMREEMGVNNEEQVRELRNVADNIRHIKRPARRNIIKQVSKESGKVPLSKMRFLKGLFKR